MTMAFSFEHCTVWNWNGENQFPQVFCEHLYAQLPLVISEKFGVSQFWDFGFGMFIGFQDPQLNEEEKGGSFKADLLTPDSFSLPFTIFFSGGSIDGGDPDHIQFDLGPDFPIDIAQNYFKPRKTLKPEKSGLPYLIEYYPHSFPDISLYIQSENPFTTDELSTFNEHAKRYLEEWNNKASVVKSEKFINFISDLTESGDQYLMVLDTGLKNATRELNAFLKSLNDLRAAKRSGSSR